MPNEAYRRRQDEWEKKERERREAADHESPYDPIDLKSRVPLGCTLIVILAAILVACLVYRYLITA